MHPIVPAIMALGAITFLIGIFVLAWFGIQKIKIVKLLGKEYTFWRFTLSTIGSGVLLIMSSILFHQHFPYEPETEPNVQQFQSVLSPNLKYELDLILSNNKNGAMASYISQFQQEYQKALQDEDDKTTQILKLELAYKLRTELEGQGYTPDQAEQNITRIMKLL